MTTPVWRKKILEVVYKWPSGREEVRYRRAVGSVEAQNLQNQVDELHKRDGKDSPYSYRITPSAGERNG